MAQQNSHPGWKVSKQIIPGLFIGSILSPFDFEEIEAKGIQLIVNLCGVLQPVIKTAGYANLMLQEAGNCAHTLMTFQIPMLHLTISSDSWRLYLLSMIYCAKANL